MSRELQNSPTEMDPDTGESLPKSSVDLELERNALERFMARRIFGQFELSVLLVLIVCGIYCVGFSIIAVARYGAFQSTLDLGSTASQFYGVLHGWNPPWYVITHEFSLFSYVAFVPFVFAPSPPTLLVVQTVIISAGGVPLYFLSKHLVKSRIVALSLTVFYFLSPVTEALNWFDVHFEILGMPFLFLFFYADLTNRRMLAAGSFVAALSTSYLVAMGLASWAIINLLCAYLGRRKNLNKSLGELRYPAFLTSLALAWTVVAFVVTTDLTSAVTQITGAAGNSATWPGVGPSIFDVILAPVFHPSAFIQNLTFQADAKLWYLVVVFGLFLFLPLIDFRSLAGTIPWLFLALSSVSSPFYTVPYYQYTALLLPYLFLGFARTWPRLVSHSLASWPFSLYILLVFFPVFLSPQLGNYEYTYIALSLLWIPLVPILLKPWGGRTSFDSASGSAHYERPQRERRFSNWLRGARGFELATSRRGPAVAFSLLVVVVLLAFVFYTPLSPLTSETTIYSLPTITPRDQLGDEIISLVPTNSSVIAQNHLYPHFWDYKFAEPHSIPGVYAQYMMADTGTLGTVPLDYFQPTVPPFPSMGQMLLENLTLNRYGILAEAQGYLLLERNYSGLPVIYQPVDQLIQPCSLAVLPDSGMTCRNGSLVQTIENPSQTTLWYGPYYLLPPGTYQATFNLQISAEQNGNLVNLGAYSFYPGPPSFDESLASDELAASSPIASDTPVIYSVNFTVVAPGLVQLVANSESPNVLINLEQLTLRETSPKATSVLGSVLGEIPESTTYLVQSDLSSEIGWYGLPTTNASLSPTYILANLQSPAYYEANSPESPALSSVAYTDLSNVSYSVRAESGGYLLLQAGYHGTPSPYSGQYGTINPCNLAVLQSAFMTCENGKLSQSMNSAGAPTVWYGPYITLQPGHYDVNFTMSVNRTLSSRMLTIGAYSFLPGTNPVSSALASRNLSGSSFAGVDAPTTFSISFTIVYPAQIQFIGNNEMPGFLVTLDGLNFFQTST